MTVSRDQEVISPGLADLPGTSIVKRLELLQETFPKVLPRRLAYGHPTARGNARLG